MKHVYKWHIRYYGRGLFLRDFYTEASTKEDALKKLRNGSEYVNEILFCRRTDKW